MTQRIKLYDGHCIVEVGSRVIVKWGQFYWFSIAFQHSVSQGKAAILIKSRGDVMKSCNCSVLVSCGNDRTFAQSHPFSGLEFTFSVGSHLGLAYDVWSVSRCLTPPIGSRLEGSFTETLCYCSHNGLLKMKWPEILCRLSGSMKTCPFDMSSLCYLRKCENFNVLHSYPDHSIIVISMNY